MELFCYIETSFKVNLNSFFAVLYVYLKFKKKYIKIYILTILHNYWLYGVLVFFSLFFSMQYLC